MTEKPTLADDLAALIAAREAATKGPWKRYRDRLRPTSKTVVIEVQAAGQPPIVQWAGFDDSSRSKAGHAANARFIALAANVVEAHGPRLLWLAEENDRLRGVVLDYEAQLSALVAENARLRAAGPADREALAGAMWAEGIEAPTGRTPKSRTLSGAYLELADRLLGRVADLRRGE